MQATPLSAAQVLDRLVCHEAHSFGDLEARRDHALQRGHLNFPALESQRLAGSNTLRGSSRGIECWRYANTEVGAWIQAGEGISLDKIFRLNALLCPESDGQLRTSPIYAALGAFVTPHDLEVFTREITACVLARSDWHPVLRAAQLYQWICSFHPFRDGNGRTARLAADAILLEHDYPPFAFTSPFDGMCGIKSNTLHWDGDFGVRKAVKWINFAFDLLLSSPGEEVDDLLTIGREGRSR